MCEGGASASSGVREKEEIRRDVTLEAVSYCTAKEREGSPAAFVVYCTAHYQWPTAFVLYRTVQVVVSRYEKPD